MPQQDPIDAVQAKFLAGLSAAHQQRTPAPGTMLPVEITSDPLTARDVVQEIIKALRGPENKPASRAVALAITKLQEARFWLGEAAFGEP